jgi:hypothetical protein
MENTVSLANKTATAVSNLAKLFGMSNSECLERLLSRFVFDPIEFERNVIIAEEVEQIVCLTRSEAEALAKRLNGFAAKNRNNDPSERSIRASAVQYSDGWGVKAARV